MFKRVLHRLIAWFLSALFTVLLGVSLQTQMVISGLNDIGANISLGQSLSMTAYDLTYLSQLYGLFIFIALLVAFLAGGLVFYFAKFGRPVIYAVSGGVAILVMLFAMKQAFFDVHLIAGASDSVGITLQVFAGVVGGLIFERLSRGYSIKEKSPV